MPSYQTKRVLTAGGTILLIALTLAAILRISQHVYARVDLTADRRYTLSDSSKRVIAKVKSPVTIHFYYSRGLKQIPVPVKDYARRVEDLLREYEIAGDGQIIVKRINAQPRTDGESAARIAGIEAQLAPDGSSVFYFGIDIDCVEQSQTLPTLVPERESILEYEITRAIQRVSNPRRPVVGIMSALPVLGPGKTNPFMVRSQRRPWMFAEELKQDYDVRNLTLQAESIPAAVDVVIVVHPKAISPMAVYALDQFILRGGKVIAFVDPFSATDARRVGPLGAPNVGKSSLSALLKAWGITFNETAIVVDPGFAFKAPQGMQPAFLLLDQRAMSDSDPATSALGTMLIPYAGAFEGAPADGLQQDILIRSSDNARLLPAQVVQLGADLEKAMQEQPGRERALAVKLTGRFPAAFPAGPPAVPKPAEVLPELPPAPGAPAAPPPADPKQHLTRATDPGAVILVADADLLHDSVWLQRTQNPYTQKVVYQVRNDNNNFLQNVLDQMVGGEDLIGIRSRTISLPPFTVVRDLRKDTEEELREQLVALAADIEKTDKKLKQMRRYKTGQQQWIESPAEKAEMDQLEKRILKLQRTQDELNKRVTRDIDRLGARLMWLSTGATPAFVILLGLAVWGLRRLR